MSVPARTTNTGPGACAAQRFDTHKRIAPQLRSTRIFTPGWPSNVARDGGKGQVGLRAHKNSFQSPEFPLATAAGRWRATGVVLADQGRALVRRSWAGAAVR